MGKRAARIAVDLVDDVRRRLEDRGAASPGTDVIFGQIWELAKQLAGRERGLELVADWHAALSQEAQAQIDEGLGAVTARLAPPDVPAPGEPLRLVELDPASWRLALECLPPSAAELAGYDRACGVSGGPEH
jgi:hypothetical protein